MKHETIDVIIDERKIVLAERELIANFGNAYSVYRQEYKDASLRKSVPSRPLYVMLEQTFRCNLACPSCLQSIDYARESAKPTATIMSWNLFERVVSQARSIECPSIAMMVTDEPLLVPDLAKRIKLARERGFMDVVVTTNGQLMNDGLALELVNSGVTRLNFSIDAASEDIYRKVRPSKNKKATLGNVVSAIDSIERAKSMLKTHLPIVRASFVQTTVNAHERSEFVSLFKPRVQVVEIQRFYSYYHANEELRKERSEARFECDAPWRTLIVRSDGDVLPCCSFYGKRLVLGNVKNESLARVWKGRALVSMRHRFIKNDYELPNCKDCSKSY